MTDNKGKQRKRYPYSTTITPFDKLQTLSQDKSYLKEGAMLEQLDALAQEMNDTQAATQLQEVCDHTLTSGWQ